MMVQGSEIYFPRREQSSTNKSRTAPVEGDPSPARMNSVISITLTG